MKEFFLGAIFGSAVALIGVVFGIALSSIVRRERS